MNAQHSTRNAQRFTQGRRQGIAAPSVRRGGFSLLELLAVMSIVALLATLAVTSWFSAVRGMARRSAAEHFLNTLTQARQQACIDGVRVSLIAFNQPLEYDDNNELKSVLPSYVVCRELGRISYIDGNDLYDEFADLKQLFGETSSDRYTTDYKGGLRIYNLSKGYWVTVKPSVSLKKYGSEVNLLATVNATYERHQFQDYALEMTGERSSGSASWSVGDAYGVEVSPVKNLPKTFFFDELPHRSPDNPTETFSESVLKEVYYVTFGPDGRSVNENGTRSVPFTIKSSDKMMKAISYRVETNGKITN